MKALVTGGNGFLGQRIVELLTDSGHEVVTFARSEAPTSIANRGTHIRGDLRDANALPQALKNVDVVFHVASKTGYWGAREEYVSINVDGARNLLQAARDAGVGRFIYTSTPSVIGYERDAEGIAEAPYPERWESLYGETKAKAEQLVLAANSQTLRTVALRPHLVFGPRDNHLLPRVVARARSGRLVQVGDGLNRVDMTDVDNAAWAHLDAANALASAPNACAGRAYFISNGEPVLLWPWTQQLLDRLGAPRVTRTLTLSTALAIGGAMEKAWTWLPLPGEPPMTRFLASALARHHWYDLGPAQRDLGYHVRVSMEAGLDRVVHWMRSSTEA